MFHLYTYTPLFRGYKSGTLIENGLNKNEGKIATEITMKWRLIRLFGICPLARDIEILVRLREWYKFYGNRQNPVLKAKFGHDPLLLQCISVHLSFYLNAILIQFNTSIDNIYIPSRKTFVKRLPVTFKHSLKHKKNEL